MWLYSNSSVACVYVKAAAQTAWKVHKVELKMRHYSSGGSIYGSLKLEAVDMASLNVAVIHFQTERKEEETIDMEVTAVSP